MIAEQREAEGGPTVPQVLNNPDGICRFQQAEPRFLTR